MNRTRPRPHRARPAIVLATALALPVLLATGAGAERGPLAAATVYANGVDFLPAVDYSGARITVAGPSGAYELSFGAREPLSIGLFGPDGQLLPDGVYHWRLALTPTAFEARALRHAARQSGGRAAGDWQALSGTFALRNGLVADPDLVEARPARPREAPATGLSAVSRAAAVPARAADDGDEAVASGRAYERPGAAALAAGGPTPADPERLARTDAGAALRGRAPIPDTASDEPQARRYRPTDGQNGREQ